LEDQERAALSRLDALLERTEKPGVGQLGFDELRELARLYRSSSTRLARLRDRDADPDAIRYLNALCVRAHGTLYSAAESKSSPNRTAGTAGRALVRALARSWRAQSVAWALLVLGMGIGASLTLRDPEALYALLPAQMGYAPELVDRLWTSPDVRADFLRGKATDASRNVFFGSYLFSHNTRVGVLAFATGMLAGVPSVLLQLYNGLILGAFATLFLHAGPSLAFAAWLLPHAIPELTAITLCCAAGLLLGSAIAAPGRRTRTAALREVAGTAMGLVLAAVPLFLAAALVESFVRESALGPVPRLAVAAFFGVALVGGSWLCAHLARRESRRSGWVAELASLRPPVGAAPGSD
jgi:uncharacterized membrane protein SpoIIM required for sporulation